MLLSLDGSATSTSSVREAHHKWKVAPSERVRRGRAKIKAAENFAEVYVGIAHEDLRPLARNAVVRG